MDNANDNPELVCGELSDLNAFFMAFEKMKQELQQQDIPTLVVKAAKDELGWYVVTRIRPSDKY